MLKIMGQPERRRYDDLLKDYLKDHFKDDGFVVYDGKVWKSETALFTAYGLGSGSGCCRKKYCEESHCEVVDHFLFVGKAFVPTPELEAKNLAVKYRGNYFYSWRSVAHHYGFTDIQFYRAKKKCDGDGRKAVETLVGPDYEPDYDLNFDPDFKPAA